MRRNKNKMVNIPPLSASPPRFVPIVLLWIILSFIVSACVTTGVQKAEKPGQAQQSQQAAQQRVSCTAVSAQQTRLQQGESKQGQPQQDQSQQEQSQQGNAPALPNNQNCLPKGVIEIAENYPVDPEVREEFQQAFGFLKEEKYEEAIRLLRAVIGKAGKFTAPYINLGIAYARTGELEKAENSLKKALELNNSHPVAMNEMGMIYRKTGRYTEARKLYETLLTLYPDFLPVRKNLGVLCDIYLQDLNCALENYEAYLQGKPEDEKVKIWVADVKSRMQ